MEYKEKKIVINDIDTSEAEKNFLNDIVKKHKESGSENSSFQTFFLNGIWGSGKSKFVEKTEKLAKKLAKESKVDRNTFKYLKLWEIRDERSVITIAFNLLHPVWFWGLKILTIIFIIIAILMTPAFNFEIIPKLPLWFLILATVVALGVTVFQFFKVKSDRVYSFFLPKHLKKKVLIIDDFDRVSDDGQVEAYKMFNILHGKLPVIFAGDYYRLAKNDGDTEKYLQKIIDRRIELPLDIQSRKIKNDMINQLIHKFELGKNSAFYNIFNRQDQNRTLRELHQFKDLLNQEFIDKNKLDTVQTEQLVTVIYLFLFYPSYYDELRQFGMIQLPVATMEDRRKEYRGMGSTSGDGEKKLNELFYEILYNPNDDILFTNYRRRSDPYPIQFSQNKEAYFVDTPMSNLSEKKAREIFCTPNQLKEEVINGENEDFLTFLKSEFRKVEDLYEVGDPEEVQFSQNRKELNTLAFQEIKNGKSNRLIDFVVFELKKDYHFQAQYEAENSDEFKNLKPKEATSKREEIRNRIIGNIECEKWQKFIYDFDFDLSTQIQFFLNYGIYAVIDLLTSHWIEESQEIILNNKDFQKQQFKSKICYFALSENLKEYRSNDSIKKTVEELSDEDFLDFWKLMGLLSMKNLCTNYNYRTGETTDNSDIIDEIWPRFEKIAEIENISFTKGSHK